MASQHYAGPRVTVAGVLLLVQLCLLSAYGCGWHRFPLWIIFLPTWIIPLVVGIGVIGLVGLAIMRVVLSPFIRKNQ